MTNEHDAVEYTQEIAKVDLYILLNEHNSGVFGVTAKKADERMSEILTRLSASVRRETVEDVRERFKKLCIVNDFGECKYWIPDLAEVPQGRETPKILEKMAPQNILATLLSAGEGEVSDEKTNQNI